MLGNQPVQFRDAHALRRGLGEALEATGRPQGLALGFQRFDVEIGHGACSPAPPPM